ncbi:hypothetical protein [Trinickia sp. EG282A]|uniref:hypothetical protein n=1 Tax=Trinickia sp. EG282A TaxID=3237013 RepID=UPI0034D2A5CD
MSDIDRQAVAALLTYTSAAQNMGEMVGSWAEMVEGYGEAVSRIGARMVVLCKFVDAVLPQLTAVQCADIDQSFRRGVEDAMARTDDMELPGVYHTTLLDQTNVLLSALESRGVRRR